MIGSGVFLLPASLALYGSISLVAWSLTALGAVSLALVFAGLSRHHPKVGGPYAYSRAAFGEFMGFQVAYTYWIALWVGNAAIVIALIGYLGVFFPDLAADHYLAYGVSLAIVWFLTVINCLGVSSAARLQLVTTVLKILPLLMLTAYGIFFVDWHNLLVFNITGKSNLSALTGAATLTLWSFIGLESATVPADDVENPTQTIPRATVLGTVITAIVYIVSGIVVMGLLPMATIAESSAPYAIAAQTLWGSTGRYFLAIAAIVSCFGALNGWTLLQGQVPMAAAKEHLFPESFAKLSSRHAPVAGLVVSSLLISLLLLLTLNKNLVEQFTFIILLATLSGLIAYLLSTMAYVLLVIRNDKIIPKLALCKTVVLAAIAFAYSYWTIIGSGREVVYFGTLLFFSGVPIYVWIYWRRQQSLSTNPA